MTPNQTSIPDEKNEMSVQSVPNVSKQADGTEEIDYLYDIVDLLC